MRQLYFVATALSTKICVTLPCAIFPKELKKRRICGNIYMYVQFSTSNFVNGSK